MEVSDAIARQTETRQALIKACGFAEWRTSDEPCLHVRHDQPPVGATSVCLCDIDQF
jgi:hypothetical protein